MRPLLALLAAISTAFAQPAVSVPSPNQLPENVIHINVNLVQVDATVTDKNGRLVKDLKPEDFEILQDGKPQAITNFTYINVHPDATPAPRTPAQTKSKPIPPPPMNLKPGDIRRTVALVVDDLGLSFESAAHVREALKRFVDREMQPGDLVAIVRTGAGMGSLQQFTADKRILYAAIDRIKYNSLGRVGVSSFEPLSSPDESTESTAAADAERSSIFAAGTLGAVRFVVNGLHELPGRKAVLLFSESLKMMNGNDPDQRVRESMRHLIDAANRASVVFYTIDPRGLQYFGLTAADNTRGRTPQQISQVSSQRSQQVFDSQGGLAFLADQTGGKFYFNTNDIGDSVHKAVTDSEGYYLLAYHPAASTFDAKTGQPQFHSVRVRVKTPGLMVRSRRGFYGRSDALQEAPVRTEREQIQRALYSPFTSGAIHARLTTLFGNSAKDGSYLNSYLHIDVKDLQFTKDPDGSQRAVFDVVAITFGENGEAVDSSGKTYTVRLQDDAYQKALENGFYYHFMLPVKKPGFYQMRVALLDAGSRQVGSANQFIEVPDVNKTLTLSSLVLGRPQPLTAGDAQPQPEPKANAVLRIFKPGDALQYAYQILDMRAEAGKPQELQVQTRLFRDGQQVYEGKPNPLKAFTGEDLKRPVGGGGIQLGTVLKPGDYVLQIIVTSTDGGKQRVATQSMDFEIENLPAIK